MSEPTSRELSEKIADIREWLVRIDTKVDNLNEVKRTAEQANEKASQALQKTEELEKRIGGIVKTAMWAIPLVITIAGIIISTF